MLTYYDYVPIISSLRTFARHKLPIFEQMKIDNQALNSGTFTIDRLQELNRAIALLREFANIDNPDIDEYYDKYPY